MKLSDIIYDENYYPRQNGFSQDIINSYRQSLDLLPPIVVTHENILVDGYHRLIAHRIEQREEIEAEVIQLDRSLILWESVKRNATHGYQLSQKDKRRLGPVFYKQGKALDEIAQVLSVSVRAVRDWTKDARYSEKEERNQKIWELWLACWTQDEIAEKLDCAIGTVNGAITTFKNGKLAESEKPDSLQLFNLWRFQDNDERYGMDYPGRIPGQIVENVLYYYTQPFDTVIDPSVGGGTTLDVCKAMNRRYKVYDINPVRDDIKQHNILNGFPSECKGCNLIFFDPPYWKQKKGDYSKDDDNLANSTLDVFYQRMDSVFESAYETLADSGHIALIIGPTQSNGIVYDHAFEVAKLLEKRFQFKNRIIVPYTTQQASKFHVSDAKENKYTLKLYRDLLIYEKFSATT